METDSRLMLIVQAAFAQRALNADGTINRADAETELTDHNIGDIYIRLACDLWSGFYAQCFDAELANDTLNEAFTRLHNHKGEPIRNPRAWLMRVGTNWLIDFARKKGHNDQSLSGYEQPASRTGDPPEETLIREVRTRMRTGLRSLKPDDRLALVLRYGVGWTSTRIASILDTSTAAIDMRLSRARRRLRLQLERNGIEDGDVR